jgi:hypothetical protein
VVALALCATILVITVLEKFGEGGWLTLLITAALVGVCMLIKRHYRLVGVALKHLDLALPSPREMDVMDREGPRSAASFDEGPTGVLQEHHSAGDPDPSDAVAILFVGGYSGLGRHAVLTMVRMFPSHFRGIVFVSVAVLDSESCKGADQVDALERRTRESLVNYERFAATLGLRSASAFSIGTEVAVEAEKIARDLAERYPKALFVAGQLIFTEETLWTRTLHNETAFMVQKRLQHSGIPMIVLPVQISLERPHLLEAAVSTLRGAPPRPVITP